MFRPLNNRVLVKPEKKEAKGGILLVDDRKELPVTGKVVVGNDEVKPNDRILFSKFGYDEVEYEGEPHYVVSSNTILAIL